MIKINGRDTEADGMSLQSYLEQNNYCQDRIAVERNGSIVPPGQYKTTLLSDKDRLEIVHFVGGG